MDLLHLLENTFNRKLL